MRKIRTSRPNSPSPSRPKRKRKPAKKFSPEKEEEKSPKQNSPKKKVDKEKKLTMVQPQGSTFLVQKIIPHIQIHVDKLRVLAAENQHLKLNFKEEDIQYLHKKYLKNKGIARRSYIEVKGEDTTLVIHRETEYPFSNRTNQPPDSPTLK